MSIIDWLALLLVAGGGAGSSCLARGLRAPVWACLLAPAVWGCLMAEAGVKFH